MGAGAEAKGDTSVKKGQQLYTANCAQCHGGDSHGDGPLAKRLDPPPADLIVHAPEHSDQQLLDWIANDIPTTAMPAFGKRLSVQDREAILNYLRNLTKDATPGAGRSAAGTRSRARIFSLQRQRKVMAARASPRRHDASTEPSPWIPPVR